MAVVETIYILFTVLSERKNSCCPKCDLGNYIVFTCIVLVVFKIDHNDAIKAIYDLLTGGERRHQIIYWAEPATYQLKLCMESESKHVCYEPLTIFLALVKICI